MSIGNCISEKVCTHMILVGRLAVAWLAQRCTRGGGHAQATVGRAASDVQPKHLVWRRRAAADSCEHSAECAPPQRNNLGRTAAVMPREVHEPGLYVFLSSVCVDSSPQISAKFHFHKTAQNEFTFLARKNKLVMTRAAAEVHT